METWRLLDTGLGSAERNVALARALLESRAADEIAGTLRFLRFAPCALLGCRQSPAQELHRDACGRAGLVLQRRITGGGLWIADERHLGWELYLHRRDLAGADTRTLMRRLLHAAATGLSALGIDARFRARDEIEVDGRTLATGAHASEGPGVLIQGLIALQLDYERSARVARLPFTDPASTSAALRARSVGLAEALGRAVDPSAVKRNLAEAFESELGVEFRDSDLSLTEHARHRRAAAEVDTRGWLEVVARPESDMPLLDFELAVSGGKLRASLKYEAGTRTLRQVWFSGDVTTDPRRGLLDLEAALRDLPIDQLSRRLDWYFGSHTVRIEGAAPKDFLTAVRRAAGQPLEA